MKTAILTSLLFSVSAFAVPACQQDAIRIGQAMYRINSPGDEVFTQTRLDSESPVNEFYEVIISNRKNGKVKSYLVDFNKMKAKGVDPVTNKEVPTIRCTISTLAARD